MMGCEMIQNSVLFQITDWPSGHLTAVPPCMMAGSTTNIQHLAEAGGYACFLPLEAMGYKHV